MSSAKCCSFCLGLKVVCNPCWAETAVICENWVRLHLKITITSPRVQRVNMSSSMNGLVCLHILTLNSLVDVKIITSPSAQRVNMSSSMSGLVCLHIITLSSLVDMEIITSPRVQWVNMLSVISGLVCLHILTLNSLGEVEISFKVWFQTHFSNWYLEQFLLKYSKSN